VPAESGRALIPCETMGEQQKYPGLPPLPPAFVKEFPPIALVVEEKCIACDRCPPICFFDAIVMENRPGHRYKRSAFVIPENCTGCGLCFEACPTDAFLWIPDKTTDGGHPKATHKADKDIDV
jgi:formate hydrogenlyase subunit 6/NADH:ubiquinone oxidoreductase subunit I